MELQIITDKQNPILKRREISVLIKNTNTPSRVELKKKLAATIDSTTELIVVERLNNVFGKQETIGSVCIYQDENRLDQVAHKYLLERDTEPQKEEAEPEVKAEEAEKEAEPEVKAEEAEKEAEPEVKAEEAEKEAEPEVKAEEAEKEAEPEVKAEEAEKEAEPEVKAEEAEKEAEPEVKAEEAEKEAEPEVKAEEAESGDKV